MCLCVYTRIHAHLLTLVKHMVAVEVWGRRLTGTACLSCMVLSLGVLFIHVLLFQIKMASLNQYTSRILFLVTFPCQEVKRNSLSMFGHYSIFTCWPLATRPQIWTKMYFLFSLTPYAIPCTITSLQSQWGIHRA